MPCLAVLVLNKCDAWDEDDREVAEALKTLYSSIGYPVAAVSAKTGKNRHSDGDAHGKVTLLAGNSGVGKSSLINALVPDARLRVGEISDTHHTGTHTTTFSEMVDLPGGGSLIDIPGVKGFGTIDFEPAEVSHYFPEIFRYGRECRYGDCRHTGEPGCAVAEAVAGHYISESRYASYLSIRKKPWARTARKNTANRSDGRLWNDEGLMLKDIRPSCHGGTGSVGNQVGAGRCRMAVEAP